MDGITTADTAKTVVVDSAAPAVKGADAMPEVKSTVDAAASAATVGAPVDVRVAVVGNVDSGKSTLVGCLTKRVIDDGRGMARSLVFRFRHEQENGRTSSVATEVMGFTGESQVAVDTRLTRAACFQAVHTKADHTITLVDLCGHERYLKTTVFGLTALVPDYAMVIVGANMGVSRMTKEHIGICFALNLPVIVIVTKVDIAPTDVFQRTLSQITRILKPLKKMPLLVSETTNIDIVAKALIVGRVVPVITCSSVTGEGLDRIRALLNKLQPRALRMASSADALEGASALTSAATGAGKADDRDDAAVITDDAKAGVDATTTSTSSATGAPVDHPDAAEVQIDSVFNVTGVGTVVAGSVLFGKIHAGDNMLLGPDVTGQFIPVVVRTIHVQYTPSPVATCGGTAAFAVRPKGKTDAKKGWAKKGMFLIHPSLNPKSYWEFTAKIIVLHHQTTMTRGYAPVMHIGVITQSAKIVDIINDETGETMEALRTNDRAIVKFRFMYRPEFLSVGSILLFREGRAKGVGRVTHVGDADTGKAGLAAAGGGGPAAEGKGAH